MCSYTFFMTHLPGRLPYPGQHRQFRAGDIIHFNRWNPGQPHCRQCPSRQFPDGGFKPETYRSHTLGAPAAMGKKRCYYQR